MIIMLTKPLHLDPSKYDEGDWKTDMKDAYHFLGSNPVLLQYQIVEVRSAYQRSPSYIPVGAAMKIRGIDTTHEVVTV